MEIRNMWIDDEDEIDFLLRGWLVDDEGCERGFAARLVEQDIVEFDDEGLTRVDDFTCREFIDKALFQDDRLGIFGAFAEAKKTIERSIEENPVLASE